MKLMMGTRSSFLGKSELTIPPGYRIRRKQHNDICKWADQGVLWTVINTSLNISLHFIVFDIEDLVYLRHCRTNLESPLDFKFELNKWNNHVKNLVIRCRWSISSLEFVVLSYATDVNAGSSLSLRSMHIVRKNMNFNTFMLRPKILPDTHVYCIELCLKNYDMLI